MKVAANKKTSAIRHWSIHRFSQIIFIILNFIQGTKANLGRGIMMRAANIAAESK